MTDTQIATWLEQAVASDGITIHEPIPSFLKRFAQLVEQDALVRAANVCKAMADSFEHTEEYATLTSLLQCYLDIISLKNEKD